MNELKAFKINVDPANVLFFSQRNFYTWNMDSKDCAIGGNGLKNKRMENTLRGCTHQYLGAAQRLQREVKLRKSPNRRKSTVCLVVKPLSAGQHSFHGLFHQTPQFFWGTFINIVLFLSEMPHASFHLLPTPTHPNPLCYSFHLPMASLAPDLISH